MTKITLASGLWALSGLLALLMAHVAAARDADQAGHLAWQIAKTDQTGGTWAYRHLPDYTDDRADAIRRRAEFRSQQRALRLAAQKWYGVSSSRPSVSTTVWWGLYPPARITRPPQRFVWVQIPTTTGGSPEKRSR